MNRLIVDLLAWLTQAVGLGLIFCGVALLVTVPERAMAAGWLAVLVGGWATAVGHLVHATSQETTR